MGPAIESLDEKIGSPGNKLQLESLHIEFFVIKDWFHADLAQVRVFASEHEQEHEHERYFATGFS